MHKIKFYYRIGTIILFVALLTVGGQPQSSGDFVITQTVIANGGGTSADTGNVFSVTGTSGQSNAGDNSNAPSFNVKSGFWTAVFSPTAANASVSGRVARETGAGIRGVFVTLTGGTLTAPRIYLTNNFGYFRFEEIEVGQTYVVSVSHRKYGFAEPSRAFTLLDDLTDLDFVASWGN